MKSLECAGLTALFSNAPRTKEMKKRRQAAALPKERHEG